MSMVKLIGGSGLLLLVLAGIAYAATERDAAGADVPNSEQPMVPVEPIVAVAESELEADEFESNINTQTNTSTDTTAAVIEVAAVTVDAEPVQTMKAAKSNSAAAATDASRKAAPIFTSPATAKRPQAISVELNEPVVGSEPEFQGNTLAPVVEAMLETPAVEVAAVAEVAVEALPATEPLVILDTEVLPSTTTRLSWSPSQTMEGIATPTPVLIVNGAKPGPVLCLTAALHGDELNGIEVVRRILYNLDPEVLSGTVIGVPIVNLQGFHRSSRYLTDRRDLNRFFPGNPQGSSASRIAYSFFQEVISHCNALVDLHTGSFHRTNMPQLRADLSNPKIVELTQGFGATVVLKSRGAVGTLRRAAADAGIPAVTLEAGESMRLQEASVKHGVDGIGTLMNHMGMVDKFSLWGDPEPVYYNSAWVRSERGGILFSQVKLAARVDQGDLLGVVTDPITNIKSEISSPYDGRVIGMALNQVVLPGFAAFHIGIRAPEELIPEPEKIVQPPEVEDHLASATATEVDIDSDTTRNGSGAVSSESADLPLLASESESSASETAASGNLETKAIQTDTQTDAVDVNDKPEPASSVQAPGSLPAVHTQPSIVVDKANAAAVELNIVSLDSDVDDEGLDGENIDSDDFD